MQEYMIDIPKNSSKVQFFISYYSPTFRFLCPLRLSPLRAYYSPPALYM